MNDKGQAAITDALYFLLIVSGLSIFLFAFSLNYGSVVSEQMERQFGTEYSGSAFKTIFYSSTPRIEGQSLQDADEIDYLLATIKEDFADNRELDRRKGVLANNVAGIMEPLQGAFDYAFYIYTYDTQGIDLTTTGTAPTGAAQFVFLMLSLHEKTAAGLEQNIYLCKPPLTSTKALENLDSLLAKVGSVSSANNWIRLPFLKVDPVTGKTTGTTDFIAAQMNLAMWVSSLNVSQDEFNNLGCTIPCWHKAQQDISLDWQKTANPECADNP